MIHTIQLFPGITLRCFPDMRFKQNCLNLQIVRPMCRREAAMNALLPAVLLRGTRTSPDLRAIVQRMDEMYGAAVSAQVRRIGDYQTTGLYCSFIADQYVPDREGVLAPMVEFLQELLFQPVLEKGVFCKAFVESEKKNLIATIEARRNDKRVWASDRLMQTMCSRDTYGISRLGEVEAVEKITAQGLYDHYKTVLTRSQIELFYVGAAQPEQVAELIRPLFAGLARQHEALPTQTVFADPAAGELTEQLEVAQGKLCMGFTTPIHIRDSRFAAMQLCNAILGAGMISKLFVQIREKLSLCYDISSNYYGAKGIFTVSAGIDFESDARVREEVLAQIAACARGDISQTELTAAKESLYSGLRSTHDSAGSIEGYYAVGALSGLGMTPEAYMQAVEAVTVRDVAQAAKTLKLHTVYFLKGVA